MGSPWLHHWPRLPQQIHHVPLLAVSFGFPADLSGEPFLAKKERTIPVPAPELVPFPARPPLEQPKQLGIFYFPRWKSNCGSVGERRSPFHRRPICSLHTFSAVRALRRL